MEERSTHKLNNCELENALRPCLYDLEEEEEGSVSSSSCLHYDRIIYGRHLISDYKLHPYFQCSKKCAYCCRYINQPSTDFAKYQTKRNQRFTDPEASHAIYTNVPSMDIPSCLPFSKRFTESCKLHRRTKSTDYCRKTFFRYESFGHGGLVVCPASKWIDDSMEAGKAGHLSEFSVSNHLADLHSKETAISRLIGSPYSLSRAPESKLCQECYLGRSASKISDLTFFSSSSSTCSYQSEMSEYELGSKGLLRCTWNNGLPYFIFSFHEENGGGVYIAKPVKMKPPYNKTIDFIYMFYSRINVKKGGYPNYIYRVLGEMTVSSHLSFSSNNLKHVETEFVLFDVHADMDIVGSSSSFLSMGLPGEICNVSGRTDTNSQKSSRFYYAKIDSCHDGLKEPLFDDFSQVVAMDCHGFCKKRYAPKLELAAIVINDCQLPCEKERVVGGWGLKFLETRDEAGVNQSGELSHCSELSTEKGNSSWSMNFIIQASQHGGPSMETGGPSSLLERWRTGHCDCGGWDIGCPLTVFHNQPSVVSSSLMESSQEGLKLLDLLMEGAKQGDPAVLRMAVLNEELYAVSFQSKFSALQAFSASVATVHSKAPSLRPKI